MFEFLIEIFANFTGAINFDKAIFKNCYTIYYTYDENYDYCNHPRTLESWEFVLKNGTPKPHTNGKGSLIEITQAK